MFITSIILLALLPSFILGLIVYFYLQISPTARQSFLPHALRTRGSAVEKKGKDGQQAPRILVAVAHPDDECYFFGPAILGLVEACKAARGGKGTKGRPEVFVLSLSNGNADGIGAKREKEIVTSCEVLGVPKANVTVLNDPRMQDGMNIWWKEAEVAEVVAKHCTANAITAIITFDSKGVSSHPNHRAVYFGVRYLTRTMKSPPKAYALASVPLLRKFTSFIDLAPTLSSFLPYIIMSMYSQAKASAFGGKVERALFLASPGQVMAVRRAILAHRSQLVWFRYLYMVFSRYMMTNELVEMR